MRVVVHVGTESPGSHALQRALPLDADRLDDAGVYVPHAARPVPHVAKMVLGWKRPDHDAWNALAAEIAQVRDHHTVAVSHESLWNEPKRALLRLRGLFQDADITIVWYLRDQADYLAWRVLDAQRHASQRFDLNDRAALDAFTAKVNLDYLSAAQQLTRVFGTDSVEIVPASTGTRVDHDEVGDFYRRLGVDGLGPEAALLRTDMLLTPGLAEALRKETATGDTDRADLHDVALRLSAQGVGVRQVLNPQEVRRLRRRHELANDQLSARFLRGRRIEPAKPDTGLADHRTTDELRRLLVEHARSAPLLGDEWLQRPPTHVGPFAEGWQFREVTPLVAGPLVARLVGPVGRLRFRVPFDAEQAATGGGLELHLETEHDGPRSCDVTVNGEARGVLDLDVTASVPLGDVGSEQGIYEVELRPRDDRPVEIGALRMRNRDPVPA